MVLRGPRGAGKATLIDQWIGTLSPAPAVTHLVVDRDRADSAGFWSELARELGAGHDVTGAETESRQRVRQSLRTAADPVLLVIGHAERIVDEQVHRDLVDLLRQCPQVRILLCAEQTVPAEGFGLADGCAMVLDFSELRFTFDEVVAVLESSGVDRAVERAAILVDLVRGWPGPTVALLDQRLRDPGLWDRPVDPRTAAGLVTELVNRLEPEAFRHFVLRTSVADELTADLAAALDGTDDAGEHFRRLAQSAFAVPVAPSPADSVEPVTARISVVPPARHALVGHLAASDPGLLLELHGTASRWHRDTGDPARAADHAFAAQDFELLAQVLDESWPRLMTHRPEATEAWLRALPDGALDGRSTASLVRDLFAVGLANEMPRSDVPNSPPGQTDASAPDLAAMLGRTMPMLVALHTNDRLVEAAALTREQEAHAELHPEQWAALEPDARCFVLMQWGLCRMLVGDLTGAQRDLRRAYRVGRRSSADYVARNAAVVHALARALQTDLDGAEEWLGLAEQLPRAEGFIRSIVEEWDPLVRGLVASHRGRLGDAEEALATYEPRSHGQPGWIFESYLRAHLGVIGPDPAEAMARLERDLVDHADAFERGPLANLLLTTVGVDLALRLGQPARAQDLLARAGDATVHQAGRARLALAVGDREGALTHAAAGLATAGQGIARRADLLLVYACALDGPEADAAFSEAITAVRASGAVRSLALIPRGALHTLASRRPDAADVRVLVDAMPAMAEQVEVVQLSERERLVLQELARTASHREIATRLFVSVNTVKTQVRSIHRKFGTSSRHETLAAALRQGFDLSSS